MIRIDLPVNPIPHSCIHARSRGKHRWVTDPDAMDHRRAFRDEMLLRIPRRAKQAISAPVHVRLTFWRRATHPADLDNLVKETLDGLVEAGVLEDDRHVVACTSRMAQQGPKVTPRVLIEIDTLSEEATA